MYQSHDSIYHSASCALFAKLISKFSFDNTFLPVVFILGSICPLALKKKRGEYILSGSLPVEKGTETMFQAYSDGSN